MPHSISPEDLPAPGQDQMTAEAETHDGEDLTAADTVTGEPETNHGISQDDDAADQDMTMANVGIEGDNVPDIKTESKSEVKLEDLFADIDSDEEFGSAKVKSQDIKPSSSPEAPSSPV